MAALSSVLTMEEFSLDTDYGPIVFLDLRRLVMMDPCLAKVELLRSHLWTLAQLIHNPGL